jgi:hypothetical protein
VAHASAASLVCPRCDHAVDAAVGALCPADGAALVTPDAKARHSDDPVLGRVIAGRFPVVDLIGRGGFGAVYHAVQLPVGREVAIKVLARQHADNDDLRARFFREARTVATLSHPSTVTLFDYGQEDDGLLFMALELIRGPTLRDVVKAEAPLPPQRALRLTAPRSWVRWPRPTTTAWCTAI